MLGKQITTATEATLYKYIMRMMMMMMMMIIIIIIIIGPLPCNLTTASASEVTTFWHFRNDLLLAYYKISPSSSGQQFKPRKVSLKSILPFPRYSFAVTTHADKEILSYYTFLQ